jgi:hypothetical protein
MELSEQSYDIAPTVARNPLPEGLLSYALSSETRYGYAFELTKQFCGCLCRLGPGGEFGGRSGYRKGYAQKTRIGHLQRSLSIYWLRGRAAPLSGAVWDRKTMLSWVGAFIILALAMVVLASRGRGSRASLSCPTCGAKARFQEPYWMCDACQSFVGVSIDGTNFVCR